MSMSTELTIKTQDEEVTICTGSRQLAYTLGLYEVGTKVLTGDAAYEELKLIYSVLPNAPQQLLVHAMKMCHELDKEFYGDDARLEITINLFD